MIDGYTLTDRRLSAFNTRVHQNLPAVCPLILRKVMEKQHNLIIVNCRKMAILRDFLQIAGN